MCLAPKAPSPPPPPAPIILPTAERAPLVAPPQMQTAPALPRSGSTRNADEQNALFRRRGKRSMIIQMGSTAGTNIPGA